MYHFIFPQRRQSVHSDSSSLNSAITMHKRKHKARKMSRRQRRSLERLYNKLRASGSTIIEDTNGEPPPRSPRKRKHDETSDGPNAKRTFTEESVIIIGDSDSQTPIKCKAPLVSSTPKNNHQRNVSQLNISNVTANSTPIVNNLSKNLSVQIEDLTKEINKSSYLTIDLTSETLPNSTCTEQTVIDLVNATENHEDCTVVTTENTEGCTIVLPDENSTNTSSASDITVVQKPSKALRKNIAREKKMREFADGISRMNATEKGQLLEMITEKIFSGCKVTNGLGSPASIKTKKSQAVETAEDTFIKEVILGQSTSRNSVGSNIYNPEREIKSKSGLRMVVIDGSNVAMSHGQHRVFSVKGLKICLDYFLKRGHIVKAFVPRFRCKFGKSTEPRLLDELERRGLVVYTPSREVQGKTITPYDDRYIVQCAAEFDGVIVSGDNYRDLLNENPRWRHIIETRLLQFTWVGDMIMFPKDPLGRYGPTLEEFLRHTPVSSHQVAS